MKEKLESKNMTKWNKAKEEPGLVNEQGETWLVHSGLEVKI